MLLLDIGGSYVKYALADMDGRLKEETVGQTPAHADGSFEEICGVLLSVLESARRRQEVSRVCISIPGPFDFESGISHMQHKFPSLLGRSLRAPFEQEHAEVSFLHDSTAFMLGVYGEAAERGSKSPCCVMLGTGLGFAMMRDGKVCVNASRTPAFTLWNHPWKSGICEDEVSTRALCARYPSPLSVREIAALARQGDPQAASAFEETGTCLSAMLGQFLPDLGCDFLVLGGQISKSADLFHFSFPVPCIVTEHLDDAALRGAARFACLGQAACEQTVMLS